MVARLFPSNRARFGAAHAARSLGWAAVDMLLAWHLHVRVGLTGTQTGWLSCLFLLIGGVATALAGHTLSRWQASGAFVVRIQWPATCLTAILLWAQFAVHGAAAAIVAGLAFRLTYAVQDVAQNMLAAMLPRDDTDARGYARLRVTLSALTRCAIVAGFAAATVTGDGMSPLLALVGALMIASAVALRGVTFPSRATPRPARPHDRAIPAALAMLLLRWAMVGTLLPAITRLLIFTRPHDGGWASGAVLLGGYCLGTTLGPALRGALPRSFVVAIVVASGALLILPLGVAPGVRIVAAMLHGVGVSIINVRLWSATSRLAMDEARGGYRREGVIFGTVILTLHLSTAVSMAMLGPLIERLEAGQYQAALVSLLLTTIGTLAIAAGRSWTTAPSARSRRNATTAVPYG